MRTKLVAMLLLAIAMPAFIMADTTAEMSELVRRQEKLAKDFKKIMDQIVSMKAIYKEKNNQDMVERLDKCYERILEAEVSNDIQDIADDILFEKKFLAIRKAERVVRELEIMLITLKDDYLEEKLKELEKFREAVRDIIKEENQNTRNTYGLDNFRNENKVNLSNLKNIENILKTEKELRKKVLELDPYGRDYQQLQELLNQKNILEKYISKINGLMLKTKNSLEKTSAASNPDVKQYKKEELDNLVKKLIEKLIAVRSEQIKNNISFESQIIRVKDEEKLKTCIYETNEIMCLIDKLNNSQIELQKRIRDASKTAKDPDYKNHEDYYKKLDVLFTEVNKINSEYNDIFQKSIKVVSSFGAGSKEKLDDEIISLSIINEHLLKEVNKLKILNELDVIVDDFSKSFALKLDDLHSNFETLNNFYTSNKKESQNTGKYLNCINSSKKIISECVKMLKLKMSETRNKMLSEAERNAIRLQLDFSKQLRNKLIDLVKYQNNYDMNDYDDIIKGLTVCIKNLDGNIKDINSLAAKSYVGSIEKQQQNIIRSLNNYQKISFVGLCRKINDDGELFVYVINNQKALLPELQKAILEVNSNINNATMEDSKSRYMSVLEYLFTTKKCFTNIEKEIIKGSFTYCLRNGDNAVANLDKAIELLDQRAAQLREITNNNDAPKRAAFQSNLAKETKQLAKNISENDYKNDHNSNKNQEHNEADNNLQKSSNAMKKAASMISDAAKEMSKAQNKINENAYRETKKAQQDSLKKLADAKVELDKIKKTLDDKIKKNKVSEIVSKQDQNSQRALELAEKMKGEGFDQNKSDLQNQSPKSSDNNSSKGSESLNGDSNSQQENNSNNTVKRLESNKLRDASKEMKKATYGVKNNKPKEALANIDKAIAKLTKTKDALSRLVKSSKAELEKEQKKLFSLIEKQKEIANKIKIAGKKIPQSISGAGTSGMKQAGQSAQDASSELERKNTMDALKNERLTLEKLEKLNEEIGIKIRDVKKQIARKKVDTVIAVLTQMIMDENEIRNFTVEAEKDRHKNNDKHTKVNLIKMDFYESRQRDIKNIAQKLLVKFVQVGADIFEDEMDLIISDINDIKTFLKEESTDEITQEVESDVIESLTMLRDAIKSSLESYIDKESGPIVILEPPTDSDSSPEDKGIPLAELIMVKGKQVKLYRRTRILNKKIKTAESKSKIGETHALTKDQKYSISKIKKRQIELVKYTDELNGQIKSYYIKDYKKGTKFKPLNLSLNNVINDMSKVSNRLKSELTGSKTQMGQLKVVSGLNKIIALAKKMKRFEFEFEQPKPQPDTEPGGGCTGFGPENDANGEPKIKMDVPKPTDKGVSGGPNPGNARHVPKHMTGDMTPRKIPDGSDYSWIRLREIPKEDSYRSIEKEAIMKQYSNLIRDYFKIVGEYEKAQQLENK